jgi:hypothetical protein
MKRWLITIPIFLVAGAVVNVAVAWGCAAWIHPHRPDGDYLHTTWHEAGYGFTATIWRCAGRTVTVFYQTSTDQASFEFSTHSNIAQFVGTFIVVPVTEADLPPWSAPAQVQRTGLPFPDDKIGPNWFTVDFAFGWPAPALCYQILILPSRDLVIRNGLFLTDPVPSWAWADHSAFPLRVIWPAFALNTILYTAVLWLLIPGPFVLRRLVRSRRGLCPACAYPMGESATCTECGKPLLQRAVA